MNDALGIARQRILNVLQIDTYARERETLLAWRDVMEESLPEIDAWDLTQPAPPRPNYDNSVKRMLELSVAWEKAGLSKYADRDSLAAAIMAEIEKIERERTAKMQDIQRQFGPVGSGNL